MTTLDHDEDKAVDATKMLEEDQATVRAPFEEHGAAQTASEKKPKEEGEPFPRAQRTKLDMKVLGRTMAARKEVLLAAQGRTARLEVR